MALPPRSGHQLRLWVLQAKGSADLEINPESARHAWEESRDLATELGELIRASRASGELGVVAFLEGDTATALQLVAPALANSVVHKDTGTNVRSRSRRMARFGAQRGSCGR